jgi:uncharacterized membrane protein YkvA (DUF1232 family)
MMVQNEEFDEYSRSYSEKSLFDKIMKFAQKAGINVIYYVLLLFYTLQKKETPTWAKATIIGALGYFIVPIDAIPDLAPVIGYSDDLGALALAIANVAMYIDDEVKQKAKSKLKDWFGEYDNDIVDEIDKKFDK